MCVTSVQLSSLRWIPQNRYLREGGYPAGSSKQDKYVLRRFAKKFTFDEECNWLFCVNEGRGAELPFKRMITKEEEKLRNFQECRSSGFAGHAGRDNTIQKNQRQRVPTKPLRGEKNKTLLLEE